jgi:hypothetical protein
MLTVFVRPRPDSTAIRTETAFWAYNTELESIDSNDSAAEIKEQLRLADESLEQAGDHKSLGHFFVKLSILEPGRRSENSNMMAVSFTSDVLSPQVRQDWKPWMLNRLNEGIVV